MPHACLGPISVHLPERVETNEQLQESFPNWDLSLIEEKTGIRQRHIAAESETSSDLAVAASEKLFADHDIDRGSIDFVLFCTQTPDYPLPTTSCLIQDRLSLPTSCGALDFNLGCSGFVYGLGIADGLIQSGVAQRILFLTAETYTKYIDDADRSLRTIFGDAAAATLITASDERSMWGFKFGSDGSGGDMLCVGDGGSRPESDAIRPRHRKRWKSRLYMDGPSLINFTVDAVPRMIDQILQENALSDSDVSMYLMHQATWKMLDQLRQRMEVEPGKIPIELSDVGNTVSCTLPILIDQLRQTGRLDAESVNMLVGFGVGLSWAGCLWKDVWGRTKAV
ncbi:ketoacyl-ACP synthase III [Roseiconus lacunae]|uniref:Ketoacyl-ACP synthase III n=1 Tax=Roseiconus lacunae TaxID=2605694 RepID=A0ABT7PF64_9BACT|nr:ketoacyl-ACP synthase III [Roseiconus lacunae]MCD0458719.1 ketoacyl-ACP synthase III [Roseiconus lacunae]MDM4015008.1 ketoacyl-ACP synthase III [Roseiconus lacunae]WRQ50216.1 ketoacyl-ACP synthase III [Stieleria sp. HD01]